MEKRLPLHYSTHINGRYCRVVSWSSIVDNGRPQWGLIYDDTLNYLPSQQSIINLQHLQDLFSTSRNHWSIVVGIDHELVLYSAITGIDICTKQQQLQQHCVSPNNSIDQIILMKRGIISNIDCAYCYLFKKMYVK